MNDDPTAPPQPSTTREDLSRLRRFTIGNDDLAAIFGGRVRVVGPVMPDDAEVCRVGHDLMTDCLTLYVRSMSFDPVPIGEVIPGFGNLRLAAVPPEIGV